MHSVWRRVDHAAGRVYTRILAVVAGVISAVMLLLAAISWAVWGPAGGLLWIAGAVVFALIARSCWRSRAAISDVDFIQ